MKCLLSSKVIFFITGQHITSKGAGIENSKKKIGFCACVCSYVYVASVLTCLSLSLCLCPSEIQGSQMQPTVISEIKRTGVFF